MAAGVAVIGGVVIYKSVTAEIDPGLACLGLAVGILVVVAGVAMWGATEE